MRTVAAVGRCIAVAAAGDVRSQRHPAVANGDVAAGAAAARDDNCE